MLRLQGPADIYAHKGVRCPNTYRRAAMIHAAATRGTKLLNRPEPLFAHVSEGRWVADCPRCNAGIAVHPEWPAAHCFGCSATFSDIRVPEDWREIERLLMLRPIPKTRNFRLHETVMHLLHQNIAHGVEV